MLEEYKDLYKASASMIPDWATMDKNDLCRACIAHESDEVLYNAYLSAIICRYWGLISKFYNQSKNLAEPIDCYDWLIHAITYALKHRQWENPKSTIYNDPKGPDKAVNRCMKSSRLIYYQFHNRKKRRKDYTLISMDDLKENLNSDDANIEDKSANFDYTGFDLIFYINEIFNRKEYFLAFILDLICNDDVFEFQDDSTRFNIRKLIKHFRELDEAYLLMFANKYDIAYEDVLQAAILAKNIPDNKLKFKVEDMLLRLKHSTFMLTLLGD